MTTVKMFLQIAALLSYRNSIKSEIHRRRLIIRPNDSSNQNISAVSHIWEPLSYPLLFPNGMLGWGIPPSEGEIDFRLENEDTSVPTTQMWHYHARLLRESQFSIFGRLANEYIVDMFTHDLECRLNYIRKYQHQLPDADGEM